MVSLPANRPAQDTVTDWTVIKTSGSSLADQVLFGTNLPVHVPGTSTLNGTMVVYLDQDGASYNNAGTIWNYDTAGNNGVGNTHFGIAGIGSVSNSGLIVSEVTGVSGDITGNLAIGVDAEGFNNSGQVYAQVDVGTAIGFATENPFEAHFDNSGLVAARAGTGDADGMVFANGGYLVNEASGSILAEGPNAVALSFGRGLYPTDPLALPQIYNQGLIEAQSTDPNTPSVGILVQHLDVEQMFIVNSGTVEGDYAFYASPGDFSPPQEGTETLTNNSTGVLKGEVYFGGGDDVLNNSGSIVGNVLMGDGNDVFDNSTGTLQGMTNLGFGDDLFRGGAGFDAARGEAGNDQLYGNGGNDLLIGDRGDDLLDGGAGNDGLYGDFGNDTIVTKGGDVVSGGGGDDRVELGDYTFASADGGDGFDTLVLPDNGKVLDLSQALASGRIIGFEAIELSGSEGI
ncbi:MAG TPA: hypothetical protein VIC34_14895, partial [Croceibacterium sp.]